MDRQPCIRCESLSKLYRQGEKTIFAVQNCNLKVYPGDFGAVIGKSGSGKSTLLNLIAGYTRPSQGTEILHRQNAVGLPQQRRPLRSCQRRHRRLPPRGKGAAVVANVPQRVFVIRTVQRVSHRPQRRQIGALGAEGHIRHHTGAPQQRHAAPGKGLRRSGRPRRGQLQHQIRPA